jgi:hypothetical protein
MDSPAAIRAEFKRMDKARMLCAEYLRTHPRTPREYGISVVIDWAVGQRLATRDDFRSLRDGRFYDWEHDARSAGVCTADRRMWSGGPYPDP